MKGLLGKMGNWLSRQHRHDPTKKASQTGKPFIGLPIVLFRIFGLQPGISLD